MLNIILFILLFITIGLYVKCKKDKCVEQHKQIDYLTKRIQELEDKLHFICSDTMLSLKKIGDLS